MGPTCQLVRVSLLSCPRGTHRSLEAADREDAGDGCSSSRPSGAYSSSPPTAWNGVEERRRGRRQAETTPEFAEADRRRACGVDRSDLGGVDQAAAELKPQTVTVTVVRYRLADEGLDEELAHMRDEYDRLRRHGGPRVSGCSSPPPLTLPPPLPASSSGAAHTHPSRRPR
uniref:Uncharacterized protein n=1 Tax=Oryza rufipogon TaxID=4529 RepID=A0A0E0MS08_ORYRU